MAITTASQLMEQHLPKFNPDTTQGMAYTQFRDAERYLLSILNEVAANYPPDFKFIGMRRATPEEERAHVHEKLANSNSKNFTIEIAESSVYLCFFTFQHISNGKAENIQIAVYLPYVEKGSQMWIRGVRNTIIPVLTAPVFSVNSLHDQIFMKLPSTKITFTRTNHNVAILQNGTIQKQLMLVVHARIHQTKPKDMPHYDAKKDESVNMAHASILYPLCQYGLTDAFERYCHYTPEVIILNQDMSLPAGFDSTNKVIFMPTGDKPSTYKTSNYQPHRVAIAVPSEYAQDNMTLGFIGGLFYTMDSWSGMIMNAVQKDITSLDNPDLWRFILGKVVFLVTERVGVLVNEINRHMSYIDTMLDIQQISDLKREGIYVDNMIDLISYIIGNFYRILKEEDNCSLYGKRLLILRNVFEEIIKGINYISFYINSGRKKQPNQVAKEVRRHLKTNKIFSITKRGSICSPILAPTDNMAIAMTNRMVMQSAISNKTSKKKTVVDDPEQLLHYSLVEASSIYAIKRSEISGRSLVNPYVNTSKNGVIQPKEQSKSAMELVRLMTSRQ